MQPVDGLKQRFYAGHKSVSERFDKVAKALANSDSVALHAGCGRDDSIGLRSRARMTIGVDLSKWILLNLDVDSAVVGDICRLPLEDECVDIVASKYVLEHLRYPGVFIQEASRVLKPGGRLVVLTPNLRHYAGLATHLAPHRVQRWFVHKALHGNPNEVFPTFYRANTAHRLRTLATQARLIKDELTVLEGPPTLLGFSSLTFVVGILYERSVNRFDCLTGFRQAILAVFRKPE